MFRSLSLKCLLCFFLLSYSSPLYFSARESNAAMPLFSFHFTSSSLQSLIFGANMNYKPVPPYTESSLIYNRLMEEVDYPGWCQYILDLADEYDFSTSSIYDISCGTGTLLHLFPAANKYGIDISAPMIDEARKTYPELELNVGNMLQGSVTALFV